MTARALLSPVLAAVMLASTGCASTASVMLAQPRPAIAVEQVRVYYSPPPGRYEEIALLETSSGGFTYGQQNKMNSVIGKLRAEAAKLGANGVLLQGTAHDFSGSNVGVGVGGSDYGRSSSVGVGVGVNISPTQLYARAMAIHVIDPPPAGMIPTPPRD